MFDDYRFEVKRQIRPNIKAAMAQCIKDIKDAGRSGDQRPIVVTKADREPIMVTMLWEDWLELFKRVTDEQQVQETAVRPDGDELE